MNETRTFLHRAALAGAVAIPIAACAAVVLAGDGEQPTESKEQAPCDGCGEMFSLEVLTECELETHWCPGCLAFSAATVWDAGPTKHFDCVEEDDGEL